VTTGTIFSDDWKDLIKFAIKGNVLNAGNGNPPTEFNQALEAFYQIFESQIDSIVSDDIITGTFGEIYTKTKHSKLAGRDDYTKVKVNENKFGWDESQMKNEDGMSKEERSRKRMVYKDPTQFVNKDMEDLERRLNNKNIKL
jgi:hypothetical protein